MFMAKPYNVPANAATVLAQICCFNGILPQGAPTSPVVSNMICAKLDSELLRLARRLRCTYTRYADDITISTTRNRLPAAIGRLLHGDESTVAEIGDALQSIIATNGFAINSSKTRIQGKGTRKEVTGLIVNESPNVKRKYVRQLRAITHAIERYGVKETERVFHANYYRKARRPDAEPPPLLTVVEGRFHYLKMVKGSSDPVYRRMFNSYREALGFPRVYMNDPLRDLPPTLWILESETACSQGSGFYLDGVGIITCQHVLQDDLKAFQYDDFTRRLPVDVIAQSKDLDIAILDLPGNTYPSLQMGDPTSVSQGQRLTLAGFPNYRETDTPYITEGRVASFRTVSTLRRFLISAPIIAGNSGGPVLDMNGLVVGVAATGADRMETAQTTEHHSIIPITAIHHLIPGN